MMRALVVNPTAEERLEMQTVADPEPAADETLVRVRAISLNRGEVNRLAGMAEGARMGWDVAGVVEQPSGNGEGLPAGTRVVGFVLGKGWAELVAVPNTWLAAIPNEVSFDDAATLPVAGLTALRTLRAGGLLLGKRVLVTGASGGVGRYAVQLGSQAGAEVTAISRNEERAGGLEGLGAAAIVHDIEAVEGPFDLILESVGGPSLAAAFGLIAPGGTIVTFGNSSQQPTTVNISVFYGKQGARLEAFSLLHPMQPRDFRTDLAFLAREIAGGRLDTQIDHRDSWTNIAGALRLLRDRQVRGKAVLAVE